MSSILDQLSGHLDENNLRRLSQAVGADESKVKNAVGTALPALIASLSRRVENEQDAQQLHDVLQKHQATNPLDQLASALQTGGVAPNDAVAAHMLGDKRQRVEQGIGQMSGLDAATVTKLMGMLAPMVLGAISKQSKQQKMGPGDLSGYLRRENESMTKNSPGGGSLIGRLLDQDGDGDFDLADALKLGMNMLFGRKK